MSINLKMKASDAFKDPALEQDEEEEEEDFDKRVEEAKFKWHSLKGIIGSITQLNREFNEFRGLNPVKIFITGPPASGKTFYAKELAKYYNIPII